MDNLKKCAVMLSESIIKANRPKLNLDIFPKHSEQPNTAQTKPQPDSFDSAVNRALNGEQVHITKTVHSKPAAKKTLSFDEAVKMRLG